MSGSCREGVLNLGCKQLAQDRIHTLYVRLSAEGAAADRQSRRDRDAGGGAPGRSGCMELGCRSTPIP